ncbi:PssE/Cps14G family polysaccharide biosynthesis glycosyltransferase [Aliivibrio fischeri]|uniref:PssE/Cps14G family polysaccharide biosynthesis glycosyltransferase n=1 Tax=Aliivibrio fischeri TaxID=668 RepID=UPI0012DAEBBA|nr:PssE/Cps14G family polysaccharide biosynthesis glycosyltransferase [Aliivibrio fischeri]MUK65331.1 glycosyltransferase [Aliivibrio fischeri]
MIKFLCTVGTTPFPSLIEYITVNFDNEVNDIFLQSAIKTNTKFIKSVDYVDNIGEYIDNYDVIVTHAGAGSIYSLLELHKKIIVVPNLERDDKHQFDISKYIEENNYGIVCWDINNLKKCIDEIEGLIFDEYEKRFFFKAEEIKGIIDND